MSIKEKIEYLRSIGLFVGSRNYYINTDFSGIYMICESHDIMDLPTKDSSHGKYFAIVGNDMNELVNEAYNHFSP